MNKSMIYVANVNTVHEVENEIPLGNVIRRQGKNISISKPEPKFVRLYSAPSKSDADKFVYWRAVASFEFAEDHADNLKVWAELACGETTELIQGTERNLKNKSMVDVNFVFRTPRGTTSCLYLKLNSKVDILCSSIVVEEK